jgi:hypothetical protein
VGSDGVPGGFRRRSPVAAERLVCVECGRTSDETAVGWRACRTDFDEDGDPPEVAFYCPACAAAELDD